MPASATEAPTRIPLREIARVFLLLGATAFGGPAAHIARLEEELVRRRRWLSRQELLDLFGVSQLLPGPNSTELAIHIGYVRGGWPGLLVAGACFIGPAALMVAALAWAYLRWGTLPEVTATMRGLQPVVIAIVARALWSLRGAALPSRRMWLVLAASLAAAPWINELAVLLLAGVLVALPVAARRARALLVAPLPLVAAGGAAPFSLGALFLVFLKIGAVLYGSGYVLLAFLRGELVERRGWLTETQLLDAVVAGQITPGPLFTAATFVGYLLGGAAGAVVATVGIFLPAFLFVAASGAIVARVRAHPAARAFLDGVNVGSIALMAWVTWQLGRAAIVDAPTALIALAALAVLALTRVGSPWVMLAGALAGLALGAPS